MLSVKNLSVHLRAGRGDYTVLEDVSFDVKDGECFALVGESGCGKSMMALALMRLLPNAMHITKGEILCDGEDFLALSEEAMTQRRGKKVAMIFQEPSTSLNPVMTIGAQIEEVLTIHRIAKGEEAKKEALYWLERVGIDRASDRYGAFPHELSGGQKQRVMIAMALAAKPDLLIADEPTTALDVKIQAQILALLDELRREENVALLLITHDLALVRNYADRVALMYGGLILEETDVETFFASPVHPYAMGLLKAVPKNGTRGFSLEAIPGFVPSLMNRTAGCPFASRCAFAQGACSEKTIELTSIGPNHTVRCFKAGFVTDTFTPVALPQKTVGDVVLACRDLCVSYTTPQGPFKKEKVSPIVHDVALTLHAGETLALVGESGSGKTTVAKAALRLLEESARVTGSVVIDGIDVLKAGASDVKRLRGIAQIVFQDPFASLNPRMTIGACLMEGMRDVKARGEKRERAKELLRFVGLDETAITRVPHEFSGGQRQRIAIARALAVNPKVIICDEPTSALDVSVQAQILNLMRRIQDVTGIAYLLITHNFAVVEYLADQVAVMQKGRIVEVGVTEKILNEPQDAYTQELLKAVPRL